VASVEELLREAAAGRIGIDRRFIRAILDQDDPEAILRFARASHDEDRLDLDPLLVDLFRYIQKPERIQAEGEVPPRERAALDFYVDAIRRNPEEVDDALVQALLPFGEKAAEPLLKLYEELGEERGSDIAFLLAVLRLRDPRVLKLLLDRLEFDAADGAFCLGLSGDPGARPALESLLADIPEGDVELRREIQFALEQIEAPEPKYQIEPFDIFAEYPEHALPAFDLLEESERIEMLASPDAEIRAGAAHSFFNQPVQQPVRDALLKLAQEDPEPAVRAEAWAALGDATENTEIRDALIAALNDESKPVEERGGAAVGLYAVADRDDVRKGIEALYALGGKARIRALEAMWRSLWQPYAKYFGPHLNESDPENRDPELLKHALRGAGYFRLTGYIDKIATFFDREGPYDELRDDALFAYALAMPGETTRGRVKGMLRKIESIAHLSPSETELVMFALDERLRLHGLAPVFEAEREQEHEHEHEETGAASASPGPEPPAAKVGRNDPCPCGSGKKYKKCHGA
jgi:hypothetical protein